MVKFNKSKHKISPWITKGIIRSIQYRDNLYKTHKMTASNSPEFDIQTIYLKPITTFLKSQSV